MLYEAEIIDTIKKEFTSFRDLEYYLDISHPILFSFTNEGTLYIGFVTNFSRLRKNIDVIISSTRYEEILQSLNGVKSLRSLILESNSSFFISSSKGQESIDYSENFRYLIPSEEFYLDKSLPNKVDLDKVTQITIMREKESDLKEKEFKRIKKEFSSSMFGSKVNYQENFNYLDKLKNMSLNMSFDFTNKDMVEKMEHFKKYCEIELLPNKYKDNSYFNKLFTEGDQNGN